MVPEINDIKTLLTDENLDLVKNYLNYNNTNESTHTAYKRRWAIINFV